MNLTVLESPNQRGRPAGVPVDTLILHYTGMQTGTAAIARLRDPASEVSSHYVVEEDGGVVRLVAEHRRAAHAGISVWQGREMLNDSSIGIEIVNPGHEWGYRPFPPAQIQAVRELCLDIFTRHAIPPERVLGHCDVAPDRKQDPGELFPWKALAKDRIGIWPDALPDFGDDDAFEDAGRLGPVRRALSRIGYSVDRGGEMDESLRTVVRAFQRHWRPERVNGLADAGTRARLLATADLVQPWLAPSGLQQS